MKNHTKGKWEFNGRDIIVGQNIGQQRICTLVEHRDEYRAEDEANARLIAAAPDLLEACKHGAMSSHHSACSHGKRGDGNTCECHVGKCQKAIEKAKA